MRALLKSYPLTAFIFNCYFNSWHENYGEVKKWLTKNEKSDFFTEERNRDVLKRNMCFQKWESQII
jgi:hypothetical protein